MGKTVDLDHITDAEERAVGRFLRNRVAEGEFEDAVQRLAASVDAPINPITATRDERDADVRKWLEMLNAAQRTGRIQDPALTYLRVWHLDRLRFYRGADQEHDPEFAERKKDLAERRNRMRALHGLSDGAWWPPGTGPTEAEEVTRDERALRDLQLARILREFGLEREARRLEKDPKAFHALVELGRRAAVEGLSDEEVSDVLREQYVREAHASALMGAYHAAAAVIGAAMEAVLLSRCLRSEGQLAAIVQQISLPERPRGLNPRTWTFANMCRVAERAGWLPDFRAGDADVVLTGDSLITLVRELRNMLHPAKQVRHAAERRFGGMVARAHYEDALSAYELLVRHLSA
jgi:hypothetical protein